MNRDMQQDKSRKNKVVEQITNRKGRRKLMMLARHGKEKKKFNMNSVLEES